MKFLFTTLALASSTFGSLCLNDNPFVRTGQTTFLDQVSNGVDTNGGIVTGGIRGTITIQDQCTFVISDFIFSLSSKNAYDPKIKFYGEADGQSFGFPISDQFLPVNWAFNGKTGKYEFTANSNYTFPLTRLGAQIGGISFQDFNKFNFFSDAYQWPIATAILPAAPGGASSGGAASGGNSGNSGTQKSPAGLAGSTSAGFINSPLLAGFLGISLFLLAF